MAAIKSIEEKAKAYDEALERAKELLEVGLKDTRDKRVVLSFFPELAESEDKKMIQYFKDLAPFDNAEELYEKYGFSHKDAIAWLEKQELKSNPYSGVSFNYNGNTWGMCARDNGVDILFNRKLIQHISDEKQGERKSAEWSEEDERDFDVIYGIIYNSCNAEDASRLIEWLKSLKDRVQPQPKQEWSEKDKKHLNRAINILDASKTYTTSPDKYEGTINWLKSLSPKSYWKPSEEQVEAFEHFVRSIGESGYASPYDNTTKLLYSLLADLKKLREE